IVRQAVAQSMCTSHPSWCLSFTQHQSFWNKINNVMSALAPLIGGVGEDDPITGPIDEGDFSPPETFLNRHGQLTNGKYILNETDMTPHQTGSFSAGKSQWFSSVNADVATLDAAAYADEYNLWSGNRAKVYVVNGPVGALGISGEPTQWINVYRTGTGFVHG